MAKIEFYLGSSVGHIAVVEDGAVPREGEIINIRKTTFKVSCVTWCIDQADNILDAKLRVNVELEGV